MSAPIRLLRWPDEDRSGQNGIATIHGPCPLAAPDTPTYLERAQTLYDQRRARAAAFGETADLFGEAAWDIMLDLFIAHENGQAVAVDDAASAAVMAGSTAIRWLVALEGRGLVRSWFDGPESTRKLALTPVAMTMMLRYLDTV